MTKSPDSGENQVSLLNPEMVNAIVVKPTLSGWSDLNEIRGVAENCGIPCVVSSAFETGVGLCSLVSLARTMKDG